jgi:hypothetical protein
LPKTPRFLTALKNLKLLLCHAGGPSFIPGPSRPTFGVEKWLFSETLRQGARSQALQLRLKNGLNNLQ